MKPAARPSRPYRYNTEDSSPSWRGSHAPVQRQNNGRGTAPFSDTTAMGAQDSIFFNFDLPNATTWFYFSLLLAVALFFKFSRLLSMRNLDVVSLFLPVPGLLLLLDAHTDRIWGYAWLMGAS